MKSIAILQARTNSTRLPGKVLLPIGGMPIVILAAERAGNTGRKVIVATSNERSDDGLADAVRRTNIECFRGSLENTLSRFVQALARYEDGDLIFRLTADNVFPDGNLLDEMEADFLERNLEYLCCGGNESGLPYGMSAELMRLAHLREADENSTCQYEREHVTPYIASRFGTAFFTKYNAVNKHHFRCTIDCLDDYLCIEAVFRNFSNPTRVSAFSLIGTLDGIPLQPRGPEAVPRLVLGAAQLGSDYGIANKTGAPTATECQRLIKSAIVNGVSFIDTASAYGNSEQMIGHALGGGWIGRVKIISKLAPLLQAPRDSTRSILNAFVDSSVLGSCCALNTNRVDVLLLHRVSQLFQWNGHVWKRLLELQEMGRIGRLGVSVQNPEELTQVLKIPEVEHVQLPNNLLDWRWDEVVPSIREAKSNRNLVVHVRSALLQGLLASSDPTLWSRAHVPDSSHVCQWIENCAKDFGRRSVPDLCLSYVNSLDWVDGVAVGMENIEQLEENIDIFTRPPLRAVEIQKVIDTRPHFGEATLNPANWLSMLQ